MTSRGDNADFRRGVHRLYQGARERYSKTVGGEAFSIYFAALCAKTFGDDGFHHFRDAPYIMDWFWALGVFEDRGVRWIVDPNLCALLMATDPPTTLIHADELRLPFDSVYMDFRELRAMGNGRNADGTSQTKGIWLTRDRMAHLERRKFAVAMAEAFAAKAGSTDTEDVFRAFEPHLVDTIAICTDDSVDMWHARSTHLYGDIDARKLDLSDGDRTLTDFALNFLVAYRAGYLEVVEETRPWPKSSKKRKRLERRGETPTRIVVRLGQRSKTRARGEGTGTGFHPRAHWVRGHWRGYWVHDVTDENPIRSKVVAEGKQAFLVLRWIEPFVRAGETAPAPEYKLVDGRQV